MCLPIIFVFERHWDTVPKIAMETILPDLNTLGYGTLCFEAPQNLSSAEIMTRLKFGLKTDSQLYQQSRDLLGRVGIKSELSELSFQRLVELARLHVSSHSYLKVAEKIKQLPGSRAQEKLFLEAKQRSISLEGIDINSDQFDRAVSGDCVARAPKIEAVDSDRITTFVQNILKLRNVAQESIIFLCGALHAEALIGEFKRIGLGDEVLYYFLHSSSRYDKSIDDIKYVQQCSPVLLDHTHCLDPKDIQSFRKMIVEQIIEKRSYERVINDTALKNINPDVLLIHADPLDSEDINSFGKRVAEEIIQKTSYVQALSGNVHARFLSQHFKIQALAFLRPGSHVDVLVDATSDIGPLRKRLSEANIPICEVSINGRQFLVVPHVNTQSIAIAIRDICCNSS